MPVYLHKHLDVTQILELHAALLQTYVEQVKEAVNIMILIALVIWNVDIRAGPPIALLEKASLGIAATILVHVRWHKIWIISNKL